MDLQRFPECSLFDSYTGDFLAEAVCLLAKTVHICLDGLLIVGQCQHVAGEFLTLGPGHLLQVDLLLGDGSDDVRGLLGKFVEMVNVVVKPFRIGCEVRQPTVQQIIVLLYGFVQFFLAIGDDCDPF